MSGPLSTSLAFLCLSSLSIKLLLLHAQLCFRSWGGHHGPAQPVLCLSLPGPSKGLGCYTKLSQSSKTTGEQGILG